MRSSVSDLATSRGPECEWETCWTHWLYKCLTIAETPALYYFFAGPQQNSSLVNSSQQTSLLPSLDGSNHWFLNPGPPRDHTETSLSRRAHRKAERPVISELCQMLARGPNSHEAAHGQVEGAGRGVTQPKGTGLSDPSVFSMNPPGSHLCNSHHSSHRELLLLVSTASCEAGMGLRQRPMKPKGAFPLTQWALDQAQHLFGPLCTQHSQFILYPFLGLSLQ